MLGTQTCWSSIVSQMDSDSDLLVGRTAAAARLAHQQQQGADMEEHRAATEADALHDLVRLHSAPAETSHCRQAREGLSCWQSALTRVATARNHSETRGSCRGFLLQQTVQVLGSAASKALRDDVGRSTGVPR